MASFALGSAVVRGHGRWSDSPSKATSIASRRSTSTCLVDEVRARMTHSLKLVVLGMMGRCPYGGQTWLYLNWLRGLARLGHEVWYVEDDTAWPYDPVQNTVTDDCSYAVRHIRRSLERIRLGDRWALPPPLPPGARWGLVDAVRQQLFCTH